MSHRGQPPSTPFTTPVLTEPSLAAALRCPSHDTPQGGNCQVRACHQLCWSLQPPPSLASSGMLFPFLPTTGPSQAPQCQHGHPLSSPASGKTAACRSATCTHSRPTVLGPTNRPQCRGSEEAGGHLAYPSFPGENVSKAGRFHTEVQGYQPDSMR